VWAPSGATASSALPVLFFVHGGGNVSGSASETRNGVALYDGAALAAQTNAVVVTINYRLGPLGWLAHSSFTDGRGSTGNYGTLDQIAALEFVRRNVAGFGGDPGRVLLFGESAGAVNVCALMTSPLAHGLFAAALMESGGCTAATSAAAGSFADSFASKVGCGGGDVAGCLRGLDAATVELAFPESADVAGPKQGDFQPNADGVVLTDNPMRVLLAGAHNHVPFVVGSNAKLLSASGSPLPTQVEPASVLPLVSALLSPGRGTSRSARFSPSVPGTGDSQSGACQPKAYTLRVTLTGGGTVDVPIKPPTSVCERGTLTFVASP